MGALEVFEEYDMAKINHKLLHKVGGGRDLNPGKMIYLNISSQIDQVVEVPRIGSSYKIHTQNKMVFLHDVKIVIE